MKFQLFRGLKDPYVFLENWKTNESFLHIRQHIMTIFILSAFIFGVSGWIGLETQDWSGQFITSFGLTYDLQRFYFFLGRIALGVLYVAILLYIPALLFWFLARDYSYRRIVTLQIFPLFILLLEQVSFIALMVLQGIDWVSSPFSWGVIAQMYVNHEWTVYFLASFSIFKIWVMYWQFLSLRYVTALKWWAVILIVFIMNLSFWAITAAFATLHFHQLLFS
ncbi:hypothetical protein E2R51_09310 [Jeotgalibacillus sp. S-D1]|uniref:hypothetical protein n=1 Tax=Jeotgalibacillus sp. S-D1 TaxID=2552189 RepID=UPI00105A5F19|nr:hypothetical protein [Jeotgalibacillus sp. S-D1]TDL32856.1 hypothetical protein E2R51_09310 [Jeotgalibacillus sp. S-D1]